MIKIILKIKKPLPPSLPSSLYVRCYGFLRFGPAVRASAMGGSRKCAAASINL